MKEQLQAEINHIQQQLWDLSHKIHSNPELGFEEHKAVKWQTGQLREHGFAIETPYAGLDTSYKAVFKGGKHGPCIAFMAEYDALKGLGHACGHNLIAAMSVGAAIGLAKLMPELAGEIWVLGCPAEEGGKGKVIMLDNGGFAGVDFAMMIHPSNKNIIGRGGLAAVNIVIEFIGQAAHSKEPEQGVNALTGIINTFTGIDVVKQRWSPDTRINGIITAGGSASNVIPDYAAARFTVRAKTANYLAKMMADIESVVKAAALISGAKPQITAGLISTERYPNAAMGQVFKENMAGLGEIMDYPPTGLAVGSSDFGNVSMKLPAIHEYLAVAEVKNHTNEMAQAAISPRSDEMLIKGAKGLAMTAYDILTDDSLRSRIYAEFYQQVPGNAASPVK